MQQKLLASAGRPVKGSTLRTKQIRSQLVNLNQPMMLKSEAQTRKDYLLDQPEAKELGLMQMVTTAKSEGQAKP